MPTRHKGSTEDIRALNTFIKLNRCMKFVMARLNSGNALRELTVSQFGVLEALYHHGPLCQRAISEKLLTSTANITMVIDNLERNGWVKRLQNERDRRMTDVVLTAQGHKLIERVMPEHIELIVKAMRVLTPEEQDVLSELCVKLGKGAS